MSQSPSLFTETELEVASILSNLSYYINKNSHHYLLSGLPGWGLHKPRSVIVYHDGLGRVKPKEPGCSVLASEAKNCFSDAVASASSPATPLSLPGSSADDNNELAVVPEKLPLPAPPKSKSHKKLVEERKSEIVSLSDENAKLRKILEQCRDCIQSELSKNKIYRQAQLAATNPELMYCSGQRPSPLVDPTVLTTHQSSPGVGHHSDANRQMRQPTAAANNIRENAGLLDLNVAPPAEVAADELQFQSQQYSQQLQFQQLLPHFLVRDKAAKSAQARKRRLEIQRGKNLMSNLVSPSLPLTKISRLR